MTIHIIGRRRRRGSILTLGNSFGLFFDTIDLVCDFFHSQAEDAQLELLDGGHVVGNNGCDVYNWNPRTGWAHTLIGGLGVLLPIRLWLRRWHCAPSSLSVLFPLLALCDIFKVSHIKLLDTWPMLPGLEVVPEWRETTESTHWWGVTSQSILLLKIWIFIEPPLHGSVVLLHKDLLLVLLFVPYALADWLLCLHYTKEKIEKFAMKPRSRGVLFGFSSVHKVISRSLWYRVNLHQRIILFETNSFSFSKIWKIIKFSLRRLEKSWNLWDYLYFWFFPFPLLKFYVFPRKRISFQFYFQIHTHSSYSLPTFLRDIHRWLRSRTTQMISSKNWPVAPLS